MNLAFKRDFISVLAKHSKHLSLEHTLSIGVPHAANLRANAVQVETWRGQQSSATRQSSSSTGHSLKGIPIWLGTFHEGARTLLQSST
jgi:hypothetical protein